MKFHTRRQKNQVVTNSSSRRETAAGKQSFSTEEVARQVRGSGLDRVVSHRTLILPQLAGAVTGLLPAAFLAGSWTQDFAQIMACSAFASWFAMHYTGSTPFTSLSGVDREMRRFMPVQGGLLAISITVWLLWSRL